MQALTILKEKIVDVIEDQIELKLAKNCLNKL